MLIVGATSFSAVTVNLGNSGPYTGTGRLPIESEGNIVNTTGRVMLIVNPTDNAGTDGESLMFNFGAVGRGRAETLIGRFEAMVLDNGKKVTLGADDISATLEDNIGNEVKAYKTTVLKSGVGGTDNKLVDLTYELSNGSGLNATKDIYNGEIIASAFRPLKQTGGADGYVDGEFIDNSVNLVVKVENLEITKPGP